ncbi:Suppressor of Profilin deletion [Malassezia vespertilionis]|uniref:FCH domain-containing protein n=1 Tax=Malassezia vespertilionis TaxID=2020962 RepID=A0A2N1J922_9BASI|nr:Suppressor of Profilin deletion [Malassezia vespertilionis]PKI82982.1 hypothetical protein MVES_003057 [Malassezia vespertilionis]WFD07848.1 Suppressor of Profilin deletion [Malassezia vespertilionis]
MERPLYASAFESSDPHESLHKLQTRLKNARLFNEQLADYFAARREIEEAYVRQLQKLSKRSFLGDATYIPYEFKPVYERMILEIAEAAQMHTMLERRIFRDCEEPLRTAAQRGEWATFKQHEDQLAPRAKEITSLETQLSKDKRKYESKRTSAAQAKATATQHSLDAAMQGWKHNSSKAFHVMEQVDRARLVLLRNTVRSFAYAQGDLSRELYDMAYKTNAAVQKFNPEREMQSFIAGRVMRPRSEYASGSAADEIFGEAPSRRAAPLVEPEPTPMSPMLQRYGSISQFSRKEKITPAEDRNAPHNSPRFSVPLPSALLATQSTEPHDAPLKNAREPRSTIDFADLSVLDTDTQDYHDGVLARTRSRSRSQPHSTHVGFSPSPRKSEAAQESELWLPAKRDVHNVPHAAMDVVAHVSYAAPAPPPIPVLLNFECTERLHVRWNGTALASVALRGELTLRLLQASASGTAHVRMQHAASLTIVATSDVLRPVPNLSEYQIDLDALSQTPVTALQYEIQLDGDLQCYVPVVLEPKWRCDLQQCSLILTYYANPTSVYAPLGTALSHVEFSVSIPHETPVVGGVLTQPVGKWDPFVQTMTWQRAEPLGLQHVEPNKILARFPLARQGTPQPVFMSWHLPGTTLGQLSLACLPGGAQVALQTERETRTGAYFA